MSGMLFISSSNATYAVVWEGRGFTMDLMIEWYVALHSSFCERQITDAALKV